MPNMMRVFMFTAYELINCVTLRATSSEFTVSGNKLKTIPPSTVACSGGFYILKFNAKKLLNFLKVSANLVVTSARQCYSSKMSSYMKSSISCSTKKEEKLLSTICDVSGTSVSTPIRVTCILP